MPKWNMWTGFFPNPANQAQDRADKRNKELIAAMERIAGSKETMPLPDLIDLKEYPQAHNGVRYRCERDGSVVMYTPSGPRHFEK